MGRTPRRESSLHSTRGDAAITVFYPPHNPDFVAPDIARLMAETHKFESHYGDFLLGTDDASHERIAARSPLTHADRVRVPVLFFQGLEDRIVPPSQSEAMARTLQARGVPCGYVAFAGEGHGFRRFENLRRAPEIELSFYAQVFGFEPADAIETVCLEKSFDDDAGA